MNINPLIDGVKSNRLKRVSFSQDSGIYEESFDLELSSDDPLVEIYYTLDSSNPTTNSLLYVEPILIDINENEATIIRAVAFKDGYPTSEIVSNSYFVHEEFLTKYNIHIVDRTSG